MGSTKYGHFLFKGKNKQSSDESFGDCCKLYNDILHLEKSKNILRVANEAPLSNLRICPQFYN